MSPSKTPQTMKPATAAKKLGIYLPAAPAELQEEPMTRETLNELLQSPPEWLVVLRLNGPHPRDVVARKLGVSISGLARAGVTDALTTAEIKELLEAPPEWLVTERRTQALVREENHRINDVRAGKRAGAESDDPEDRRRDASAE
ncbi:DUF5997 family protein [Herbiconiux sp. CPCC 205716]|uniref:DUF5997 family protein n=1 Tax=Herbiconiux gentiana TaxID=2970912 RepID=A0ABT2GMK9_9MICO|nr:DUF5997 family protein [Herbiconiux gentiana]MCS5715981.1 DUF5997 family protein [Herbiconiux gentiana]